MSNICGVRALLIITSLLTDSDGKNYIWRLIYAALDRVSHLESLLLVSLSHQNAILRHP
jgi:hypothetical protein